MRLALKLVVISLVTVVILIALALVNGTISDRQRYRDDAVRSIAASYAGAQTLIGPVLFRPYTETGTTVEDDGKGTKKRVEYTKSRTARYFPRRLDVRGKLTPTERRRGLYKVTVYEFSGKIKGSMEVLHCSPPARWSGASRTWQCQWKTCVALWGLQR